MSGSADQICYDSVNRPQGLAEMSVRPFIGTRDRPIINLHQDMNMDLSVPIEGLCHPSLPDGKLVCMLNIAPTWFNLIANGPSMPLAVIMTSGNTRWWSGSDANGSPARYEQKQKNDCERHFFGFKHKMTLDADCNKWKTGYKAYELDGSSHYFLKREYSVHIPQCNGILCPFGGCDGQPYGAFRVKGRAGSTTTTGGGWISDATIDCADDTAGLLCVAVGEGH